jgi:RimJ/RimL family protein N-acetyltransferase
MTTRTIRLLSLQDLPAYKALRDEALEAFPEAFTSDFETERHRSIESFAPRVSTSGTQGNKTWGAFDSDDQLLGSISLELATRTQQRHIASVLGMFVRRASQRQGIATALVASCADYARNAGQFHQLILTVTASNTHVVNLYEQAGFVRYGLLPGAICVAGVFHDKALMRLDLRVGAGAPDKLSL